MCFFVFLIKCAQYLLISFTDVESESFFLYYIFNSFEIQISYFILL